MTLLGRRARDAAVVITVSRRTRRRTFGRRACRCRAAKLYAQCTGSCSKQDPLIGVLPLSGALAPGVDRLFEVANNRKAERR